MTDSDKPEYQYDAKTDTLTVRSNGTVDTAYIEESYPRVKTLILDRGIRSIKNSHISVEGLDNLTKVIIPDSVEFIGDHAFDSCTSLVSVTIPYLVESIGWCAFSMCTSLVSVTIPDLVKSIGYDAFRGCTSLESIDVNPNNSEYSSENGVLFDKTRTKLIRYPAGKTDDRYDVPDSVKCIGLGAFDSCTSLVSVTISDSVESFGWNAFLGCTSLESVTIPDSVKYIGLGAFRGCKSLESVTIPDSVESIGDFAFGECTSLESATIPDSVKSIGQEAFSLCTSLESVTIPDSVESIGDYAFSGCISLVSVTIPDSVESIGECAFLGCMSLESVTIPESVKSIGNDAFSECTSLASVYCGSEDVFRWKSCFPDGVSFRIKTPEQPPIRKTDYGTSSIDSTLENILRQAFEHNNRIAENLPQFISVLKDLRAPGKIVVVLECFFKYEPEKYMIALVSKDDSKANEVSLSIANEYGFSQDTVLNLITSIRNLFKKFD